MFKIIKIAYRNLLRQKRRTFLSALIIVVGILFTLVFSGLAKSFKNTLISEITDSNLSHIQIHKKGYLTSIDSIPLDIVISPDRIKQLKKVLKEEKSVATFSERIKFGGIISNYKDSTNVVLNGINPEAEDKTTPLLKTRILGNKLSKLELKKGEILIPDLIAKTYKLKRGGNVVLIATNKDGSVNGLNFKVAGILESVIGPGGRNGYIHIDDAKSILRTEDVSEIAIRINNFDQLQKTLQKIKKRLKKIKDKDGEQYLEIHPWNALSPFSNIVKIIAVMNISLQIILIALVLISVFNVMTMSVYERVKEIGTMIAIGTLPIKTAFIFMFEGFFLGVFATILGNALGAICLSFLRIAKISFTFGRMQEVILSPNISILDMLLNSTIVIIISMAASIIPAVKASKMEPVDALRHV